MSSLSEYAVLHNAIWCQDNPGTALPTFRSDGKEMLARIDSIYSGSLRDKFDARQFDALFTDLSLVAIGISLHVFEEHRAETAIDTVAMLLDEYGFVPKQSYATVTNALAVPIREKKVVETQKILAAAFKLK